MNRKILLVDDEKHVLDGLRRSIGSVFEVDTALGALDGLAMAAGTAYAAIVSDLQMPGLNGVQFLATVRERHPDVVRLILSGHANLDDAIAAVNDGYVFQFLTKPCAPKTMLRALECAARQHQLITSERDLLEKTLNDSMAMMSEILSLVNPAAFRNAGRIRRCVCHMATQLRLPNVWEFEIAAMLAQIGFIAVPAEVLEKRQAGRDLTREEDEAMQCHPATGYGLLSRIPRLETVAAFVRYQSRSFRDLKDPGIPDLVVIGAQALLIATYLEDAMAAGETKAAAVTYMLSRPEIYHPGLVGTLTEFDAEGAPAEVQLLTLLELRPGMVVAEDLQTRNGVALVAGGQRVSGPMIERLNRVAGTLGLLEPFRVRVPPYISRLSVAGR